MKNVGAYLTSLIAIGYLFRQRLWSYGAIDLLLLSLLLLLFNNNRGVATGPVGMVLTGPLSGKLVQFVPPDGRF